MAVEKGINTRAKGLPAFIHGGAMGALIGKPPGWNYFVDSTNRAPDLTWPRSIETYRQMEGDAQIRGLLMVVTLPVRRFRWEVDPNGARAGVVDHIADSLGLPVRGEVETTRRRNPAFKHDAHMAYALRALVYGFYDFERLYEIRDDGLAHLVALETRPPWTIQNLILDDHGRLEALEQYAGMGGFNAGLAGITGAEIGKRADLRYVWEPNSDGDHVGTSALRSIYRNWLVKDSLIRVDAIKHERNGMGVPWFETLPGASPDDIAELAKIAESIRAGERGGAAGPGKLHLQGVEGSLPDTIASIRYHDQQMSRTFMAMWMDLGSSETGARALGETLMEATLELQGQIADWYAEATQAQIDDEVRVNWGEDEQAPLITYTRLETSELAFKDMAMGVEKGLIEVDPELRAAIEDRWKVPGQRAAAEAEEERREAETEAKEAAGQDPRLPLPPPAPAVPDSGEGGEGAGGTEETAPPATPARASGGRPPRESGELATRIVESLNANPHQAWPELARSIGSDPKNGTARRARDVLLREGAITKRDSSGTFAVVAKLQLPSGRELRRDPYDFEVQAGVNFAAIDEAEAVQRSSLVDAVKGAQAEQIDQLVAATESNAGDAAALAQIEADPVDPGLIVTYLEEAARAGTESAREEWRHQGGGAPEMAEGDPAPDPDRLAAILNERAEAASLTLANGLDASASKRAAAVSTLPAEAAGAAVRTHLEGLSNAALDEQLGAAVHQAFNAGRFGFMAAAKPSLVYASELLDANTCSACAAEDGTQFATLEDGEAEYPSQGGFIDCSGGPRCRGTLVAVY